MGSVPGDHGERDPALAALDALTGGDRDHVAHVATLLEPVRYPDGTVLVHQGDAPERFAVIVDGRVRIRREEDGAARDLGEAGPGSVIGEIAMLRGTPRAATATAVGDVTALVGGMEAFEALFAIPDAAAKLTTIATSRLAANARPVEARTPRGRPVRLRPLLASDRDDLAAAISTASERTLRMRFFTAGKLPPAVIDYLVDLDFVHRFAWVAADEGENGAGISRYVRTKDGPSAEFAVAVGDDHQRQGIGATLLGAIAAAAEAAGIDTFTGDVLTDNRPMVALLNRLDARWALAEPGVNTATVAVAAMRSLIDDDLAAQLADVARDIRSAAHAPHIDTSDPGG
ncbi:MAG: cyclic nucleotide-binding domain-containing protein [Actinomycetota bacterium]|nr:cyclic nucleotide-binding domain-containing protein [Actinomycetota bacterium]